MPQCKIFLLDGSLVNESFLLVVLRAFFFIQSHVLLHNYIVLIQLFFMKYLTQNIVRAV